MSCSVFTIIQYTLVILASFDPLSSDSLEALAMDNGWTRLVIFLLADPHLLEG